MLSLSKHSDYFVSNLLVRLGTWVFPEAEPRRKEDRNG